MAYQDYIGIEYGYSSLTKAGTSNYYKNIGPKKVKFEEVIWGDIEYAAPSKFLIWNLEFFNWSVLDAAVKEWQSKGFEIHFVVRCKSNWATAPTIQLPSGLPSLNVASEPPKPQYWGRYANFVSKLVARYGKAGTSQSMPGLIFPVREWEIESEAQIPIWWMGTVDEYISLLSTASAAIRAAQPNCKIILTGINFGTLLTGDPTDSEITDRINSLKEPYRTMILNGQSFFYKTLDRPDLFDIVEFHALNDYTLIPIIINKLKKEFSKRNYNKEIWVGDANSAPTLYSSQLDFVPIDKTYSYYGTVLLNSNNADYQNAINWVRAEQSKLTIKKYVVSLLNGATRINMGTLEDWPVYSSFPFNGLCDSNTSYTPKPVFYAISGFYSRLLAVNPDTVSILPQNNNSTFIYIFTNSKTKASFIVLWNETGNQSVSIDTSFAGKTEFSVWEIPTATYNSPNGSNYKLQSYNNTLRITATPIPVVIS